jgi:hypothetical protein
MQLAPDQVAMLVGGILLFVVALGLLIYFVVTQRPYKPVFFLFVVAIIMIGFSKISSFKLPGGVDVELNQSIRAVEENPNDPAAKTRLAAAVAEVSQQPNITPQTRATLAKAQLVLGRRDEAAANVKAALEVKPNLKVDPKLRALVRPSPH